MLAGQNINSQMISTGRAWHYKKYSKSPTLASLEHTARANGLGLWSTPTPVAPRNYRKR
jgi:micrococcal nuclease